MKKLKWSSLFLLAAMMMTSTVTNASAKTLSMTMKTNSKTVKCCCPAAVVQGGALIGGSGITYAIKYGYMGSTKTLKSGTCSSGVSFSKYIFSSPNGYSVELSLSENQKDKKDPGIGWGRIDY